MSAFACMHTPFICKLMVFDHIVTMAFSAAVLLQLVSTITPVHLMNTLNSLSYHQHCRRHFGYISCYANSYNMLVFLMDFSVVCH